MSFTSDAAGGTEKVVHNFFTPASKKPPEAVKWSVHNDTLLCGYYDVDGEARASAAAAERPAKIAAFDFVSCAQSDFYYIISEIVGKEKPNSGLARTLRWWNGLQGSLEITPIGDGGMARCLPC